MSAMQAPASTKHLLALNHTLRSVGEDGRLDAGAVKKLGSPRGGHMGPFSEPARVRRAAIAALQESREPLALLSELKTFIDKLEKPDAWAQAAWDEVYAHLKSIARGRQLVLSLPVDGFGAPATR